MAIDLDSIKLHLAQAIDSLMLPDDPNEAVADAFHQLNEAFNETQAEDYYVGANLADVYGRLRDYEDTTGCTWVSRQYLEKAQHLTKQEKRDFCRSLLELYNGLDMQPLTAKKAIAQ